MHPLAPNLNSMTMDEVTSKYSDLTKRLNQAYRSGPSSIIPQLHMMMEHYQAEIAERNRKQLEEMERRSAESGKGYKGIIDIS